jgi:organic hydroperoxide reductase OsmC/OhrA
MATMNPKVLTYAVSVDAAGRMIADDEPVELGGQWTPDHLLLAAVVRCAIVSLAYHGRRAGVDVVASGAANGTVTIPEGEERFRFVEIAVDLSVTIDPRPEPEALEQLLAKAERDCFVGASLITKPVYRWTVA